MSIHYRLAVALCLSFSTLAWAGQAKSTARRPPVASAAKPVAKAAFLLVMCDLGCTFTVDGEAAGHADAGRSAKVPIDLGEHVFVATTEDGKDKVKLQPEVTIAGQKLVYVKLAPVHDARVQLEERAVAEKAAADRKSSLVANASSNLERGMNYYRNRDWTNARPFIADACEGGSAMGCYKLARLQMAGVGSVEHDWDKAASNLEIACNQKMSEACYVRGKHWREGFHFAEVACDLGSVQGCGEVAFRYSRGIGVSKDLGRAYSLGVRPCENHVTAGCMAITQVFRETDPDDKDLRNKYLDLYQAAYDYEKQHSGNDPEPRP